MPAMTFQDDTAGWPDSPQIDSAHTDMDLTKVLVVVEVMVAVWAGQQLDQSAAAAAGGRVGGSATRHKCWWW